MRVDHVKRFVVVREVIDVAIVEGHIVRPTRALSSSGNFDDVRRKVNAGHVTVTHPVRQVERNGARTATNVE
jgi:hypothetical protein